ncbi:MAG TPA: hypothetical protein VFX45_06210 [Solirubrobacterales bacterium]|nr:hypothetical protein [Solirubrobacterales bacterium]
MGRVLPLLPLLGLASAATALGLGASPEPSSHAALAASTSGSFVSSRDGQPIFAATGLAPGDSVRGTVELSYDGEAPSELTLEQDNVVDEPGPGGGELSRRLLVRIADVTVPAEPGTVYTGRLAPMPPQAVGRLAPGDSRTYEFAATLPDDPPDTSTQNDVQGASASVGYSWTVREATAAEPAPAAQPPAATPPLAPGAAPGPLRLRIVRVANRIRRGRLLVWARCDRPCRIAAHGRLRARGPHGAKQAALRPPRRPRLSGGVQRLAIRVPGRYRRSLARSNGPARVSARIVLRARAADGATARRARWLRFPGTGRHPGRRADG